jgi:hypothetical protein
VKGSPHHLRDRYQRVNLKDNSTYYKLVSNWSKIQHGVPPLALDESVMPILFADDTSLIVTNKNFDILDTKLSANLQIAYNWFNQIYYLLTF